MVLSSSQTRVLLVATVGTPVFENPNHFVVSSCSDSWFTLSAYRNLTNLCCSACSFDRSPFRFPLEPCFFLAFPCFFVGSLKYFLELESHASGHAGCLCVDFLNLIIVVCRLQPSRQRAKGAIALITRPQCTRSCCVQKCFHRHPEVELGSNEFVC